MSEAAYNSRGPRGDGSSSQDSGLIEKVVHINRCAKVVKGGRRFSFSALVISGDKNGKIGVGFGKANEVSDAIKKGTEASKKRFISISLRDATIPHEVIGRHAGGQIMLRPASPGTGIIAGGGARAVLEAVGVRDVVAKSHGSTNPSNLVKATIQALLQLRTADEIFRARGKKLREKQAL
jgi:small subunit ribosomal protein S5